MPNLEVIKKMPPEVHGAVSAAIRFLESVEKKYNDRGTDYTLPTTASTGHVRRARLLNKEDNT